MRGMFSVRILPAARYLMIQSLRMQRTPMPSSSASVQHDETERLKSLLQYEILDTLPDPAFDEIARMASSICNAPYAFIGFLDWSPVCSKSPVGSNARQIRRNGSPCQFLLLDGKPLIISDALADH